MKMQGVTLDFNDMRTCGIIPDVCIDFDHRSEELEENEKLLSYWDEHVKELLKDTKNVVIGNLNHSSIVYSADKDAIDSIKKHFPEIDLSTAEYEEITKCDYCITHDYMKS